MNNQKKNSKGSPGAGLLALVILIVISIARSGGKLTNALPLIMVAAIAVIAFLADKAKKAKAQQKDGTSAPTASGAVRRDRPQPQVELHRPAPSMQRREPVTAQRSFPKPEAYCVTCEASGEDHFVRDRNRRIAQLDDWLKNGLIDRQEYLVLKRRFQNDQ